MRKGTKDIVKFGVAVFLILAGAGLVFSGVGVLGSLFLWWIAYGLLTR
jgi:hypothetical protein